MEKLRKHSPDRSARIVDEIATLLPGVLTETHDQHGNPVRAIDFDRLRQEISGRVVEGPHERYQLDWPGKRDALRAANTPIAKTLRPARDDSVAFDTTQNLFLEGDNLDALKLLQGPYRGKVKLIYIDPPYNTGKDFIYADKYAESAAEYLARSGQVDANGRFHSAWLSMMYPRLELARNLLTESGLIMVSINDAEAPRLRQLLDEVFGETNFLGQLVWMKGREGGNDNDGFGQHHEYVVVYARERLAAASEIALDAKDTSRHRVALPETNRVVAGDEMYRDGEPFQLVNLSKQKDYIVSIPLTDGSLIEWPSYAPQRTIDEYVRTGRLFVGVKGVPYVKSFLADEAVGTKPSTLIESKWGTTKAGGISIRKLFGSGKLFSYPKPPQLLQRLIQIAGVSGDALVLDFFAGSAATAHAVMAANALDGGNRRFIMVQLDEPCDPRSEAAREGYKTISQLSMERVRRAGRELLSGEAETDWRRDVGFRLLRVEDLPLLADSVTLQRAGEDLLFEALLEWRLELTLPIAVESIDDREVFVVDGGALIACFADDVSPVVVREVARRQPMRAVFRDAGFAADADRTDAESVFAAVSPTSDVRVI